MNDTEGGPGKSKMRLFAEKRIERSPRIIKKIGQRKLDIMDGFMRRRERSKEDIRKAAWELFSQFGIEKVSVVDIARRAGVSQATIYNNFVSKENLVREFINTAVDQFTQLAREALSGDKPYDEKLAALPRFSARVMAHEEPTGAGGRVLASTVDLLNDPEVKRMRDLAIDEFTKLLLDLLQEGKDQGRIKADLSEEAASIYFRSFWNTLTDPELHLRFHRDSKLLQDFVWLLTYGLAGQRA